MAEQSELIYISFMKHFFSAYISRNLWFTIFSAVAIALLVTSFIVPPMGIIDSSVLLASSEMFAFAALGTVIKAIDKGMDAKIRKGDTTVIVGDLVPERDGLEEQMD